jgi:hypothetical protein
MSFFAAGRFPHASNASAPVMSPTTEIILPVISPSLL